MRSLSIPGNAIPMHCNIHACMQDEAALQSSQAVYCMAGWTCCVKQVHIASQKVPALPWLEALHTVFVMHMQHVVPSPT